MNFMPKTRLTTLKTFSVMNIQKKFPFLDFDFWLNEQHD